jgi:hypothetical protein
MLKEKSMIVKQNPRILSKTIIGPLKITPMITTSLSLLNTKIIVAG